VRGGRDGGDVRQGCAGRRQRRRRPRRSHVRSDRHVRQGARREPNTPQHGHGVLPSTSRHAAGVHGRVERADE
jgi:hypothetical protein